MVLPLTKPALLGGIVLLIITLALGGEVKGAARWLRLGGFGLQPSEFAKVAIVLVLAKYFARRYEYAGLGFSDILPAVGIVAVPFVLVALQPDLGTAGIFLIILAGDAADVGEAPWRPESVH